MSQINPFILMNAETSAGSYPAVPIPIDFRYDNDKLRSITGTRGDVNDTITVLLETMVPIYSNTGKINSYVTAIATATTWGASNANTNSCVLQGPFTRVFLKKVGASGAATFVGML